jgi:hypothetical protein
MLNPTAVKGLLVCSLRNLARETIYQIHHQSSSKGQPFTGASEVVEVLGGRRAKKPEIKHNQPHDQRAGRQVSLAAKKAIIITFF